MAKTWLHVKVLPVLKIDLTFHGSEVVSLSGKCGGSKLSGKSVRFMAKENRIYIRAEFTRKKCKTAILFVYFFHTASVLHIFMLYNLLGLGIIL